MQNIICRITLRVPFHSSMTQALSSNHWLPVKSTIKFKYYVLTYKALHTGHPASLKEYLKSHMLVLEVQGAATLSLCTWIYLGSMVECTKIKHISKAFGVAAQSLCNKLPTHIRSETLIH